MASTEECISFDIEPLFTNVPVHETLDFILHEIYLKKEMPEIYSKLIFKRLLLKLATENTFILSTQIYKQIDGCTMGGHLWVIIFFGVYMLKTEQQVVIPVQPRLYKRFVGDRKQMSKRSAGYIIWRT